MTRSSLQRVVLVAMVLFIACLDVPGVRGAIRVGHDQPFEPEIHGRSAQQRLVVRWAAGRFLEAGIGIGSPRIYLHAGTERCDGDGGFTDILPEGVFVHICVQDETDLSRKLLHEIAHVWDFAYQGIPPSARSEFLALRGLTGWNNSNDDWPERGAEQAAEIVAWGLQESLGPIPTRVAEVGPHDVSSLAAAFELLTGAPPLWMGASSRATGTWRDV